MKEMFPIFLKLDGRRVLVVGGGKMATLRAKQLIRAGARVTVIAPRADAEIEELSEAGQTVLLRRRFERTDLSRRYFIVIAATNDSKIQKAVLRKRSGAVFCVTWWTNPKSATFICRRSLIAAT